MITVDGGMMEGGGQLLRMATAYSAILGEPFRIYGIRAKRTQPGLKPQHLTTLKAAASLTGAELRGATLGSTEAVFTPGKIKGGRYSFDIGTAGSGTLLLQCLTPIAAYADAEIELRVRGGTAVRWSPTTPFITNIVWRAFGSMRMRCSLDVLRHGFYPKGGGEVKAVIQPTDTLLAFKPDKQGIGEVKGVSICGKLPPHVAERQASSASSRLRESGFKPRIVSHTLEGDYAPFSPGSLICLWADSMYLGSDSIGERGKPAEKVGLEAAESLVQQIATGATVDYHTADHMVLPCSLAEGESSFKTSRLTLHTLTAIELAKTFTGAKFNVKGSMDKPATVMCKGFGYSRRIG
ncbi:RNA 3'-terminal phosphate cyclase [Candidatus Bathyarchaeota archaeon]|nr:RNA 3'-terminal phosphate cyclase [Candidatus Bathyarchaeota archaeon]